MNKKYKILVIEDDTNLRQSLLELLACEDFKVITADNGLLGVQLAQEEIPELIICDVMMPELDGHSVLERLRQEPTTATIPFIFLTARTDKNDFRQGMNLGADDYLTKPFTRAELLTAIFSRLEKQAIFNEQSQRKLDDLRSNITFSLPHEMRTPLNGILGFSELLRKDSSIFTSHEVSEMVDSIHKSAERLLRLIQNFLLYAELEIIATDPERISRLQSYQTVFPSPAFNNLINEKAKKLGRLEDLNVNLYPHQCHLQISEIRLSKIIEELIDNALKFSSSGTTIHVNSTYTNNTFRLSFIDYGRGMTSAQISELGAYRQFERKLYEQQGSGLGLIIVKQLAELHGGELQIQSKPQEKTLVQVMLPCI